MTYRQAEKPHKGDEVMEKRTKAILTVLNTQLTTNPSTKRPAVHIEAIYESNALAVFWHTDVS